MGGEILRQLGLLQLVVDVLAACMDQHLFREIDADQTAGVRGDERTTQTCAAAGVQDLETVHSLETGIGQHVGNEARRAVTETFEFGFEARREVVKGLLDESVRCPRRHIATGARGQHVTGNRIVWIFVEPRFENRDRLVHVAERAMRQREELARVAMPGPERNRLAEIRHRLLGPVRSIQQDAQVGQRVNVVRLEFDGLAIRRLGR